MHKAEPYATYFNRRPLVTTVTLNPYIMYGSYSVVAENKRMRSHNRTSCTVFGAQRAKSGLRLDAQGGAFATEPSQPHENRPVFHREFDPGGPRRLLQCGIQPHDRVRTGIHAPQQPPALLAARREDDLQPLPLASDGSAVRQLQIHRLDIGIHVVNADTALVAGVLGQLLPRGRIHFTQFGFHVGLWSSRTRPSRRGMRGCDPANYRIRRPKCSRPRIPRRDGRGMRGCDPANYRSRRPKCSRPPPAGAT